MKNPLSMLGRLSLIMAGALALGSCSRAEYATLPRSTPYLGSTPVAAAPRPAGPAAAAPAPAAAAIQTEAVVIAPAAAPVATASPAPAETPAAAAALVPSAEAAAPAAAPQRKLNLVQRLAVAKVTKKLQKMAAKMPQLKQPDNTASTAKGRNGLDENLRIALLFGIASLGVAVIAAIVNSNFVYGIATILLVVAIVFVILWALNKV